MTDPDVLTEARALLGREMLGMDCPSDVDDLCDMMERLLAHCAAQEAQIARYAFAIRNCHILARREARREQKADDSQSSRWNHVIRLCKQADEEGTLTTSSILRDKEDAAKAITLEEAEAQIAALRQALALKRHNIDTTVKSMTPE